MNRIDNSGVGCLILTVAGLICLMFLLTLLFAVPVHGRDLGQWENSDPQLREWFKSLRMPDQPEISCCGEADAYWCDELKTGYHDKEKTKPYNYCIINDPRDDAPLKRPHVENGTPVIIPEHKIKRDQGNLSGHAIVFLGYGNPGVVYCFIDMGRV